MNVVRVCAGAATVLWLAFQAGLAGAAMDQDPEAKALVASLRAMKVAGVSLDDPLDGTTKGSRTAGPVGFGAGAGADKDPADRAAEWPETREAEAYVYYGPFVPRRGCFSLDFRIERLPKSGTRMTLFSVGTAGNTCLLARVGLDRVITATVLTRRENIDLTSDPVAPGEWHRLEWWYAPEGSLLLLDGAVEDYSTDACVPFAHDAANAFYLGDQPWWSAGKGVFYAGDSFVGRLDNLKLTRLAPAGGDGTTDVHR